MKLGQNRWIPTFAGMAKAVGTSVIFVKLVLDSDRGTGHAVKL